MAQPSQASKHQCCHSTSLASTTSSATNAPESYPARICLPCMKTKTTGASAVQPTGTTTPTVANGWRRRGKRGQNTTEPVTSAEITLALATTQ